MSELHWRSIADLGRALRDGSVTATEVTQATLERIEEVDPVVRAYATVMAKSALLEAASADEELARGDLRGPLHGIPVGVKDLCETKGVATEAGSRVLAGHVPTADAEVVRKLRAAGAIIVGKTVTHEFAYGQNIPPTRNAWDQRCYPGGSSAGSGVAVAAGTAFGAVGTDTGGSIRVPAAVNGVVGLKPTHGRVSRRGVFPMSPTLDTVGPLARTVEDVALLLAAMAGQGIDGDITALDEPVPDYASLLDGDLTGVRVGVDRDYFFYDAVRADVAAMVDTAIDQLRSLGATVVEVTIDELERVVPAGMAVLVADTSEWHQSLLRQRGDDYVRETRVMLELGELLSATAYIKAQKVRRSIQGAVRKVFEEERLDAIAAPTLPVTTMPVEELSVDLTGSGETALSAFIHHCFLANVIGIPALSVPVGFAEDGLPVGMQLFGRPFGEADLFRIGDAYQRETAWHERHPEL
jgi:aspartyl-tRNA(Asn)/glutamyl-tRNA(Gln) amidotransferase subunit A